MKIKPQAIIHLKDLKLQVIIGTLPHERLRAQGLLINITFEYDASLAAGTDVLAHAVDYAAIHAKIVAGVKLTKFFLLERLAAFILTLIMEDEKIVKASVLLEKAGVLRGAKAVSVSMSSLREGADKTNRCC